MAYAVDVVAGAIAAFTNHTIWPELRDKAPLGQCIVQHPLLLVIKEAVAMNTTVMHTTPDEAMTN